MSRASRTRLSYKLSSSLEVMHFKRSSSTVAHARPKQISLILMLPVDLDT
jgi:hypothetical protein